MNNFVQMAQIVLFQHLTNQQLVDQFNAKAEGEEYNIQEFAEIVRRELRYDVIDDKIILL